MKKKIVSLLLCFAMIFSLGLSACSAALPCTHTFTEETFLQATCVSEGVLKKTCSACGMEKCEKTEKVEHAFENGMCKICNVADPAFGGVITVAPDDETLDLGDCKHLSKTSGIIEPTCHQAGGKGEQCLACGAFSYLEIYPATGVHTWEIIVEEPTCISDGLKYRVCEVCETKELIEVLKKLGHDKENGVCTRCEGNSSGGGNRPPDPTTLNVEVLKASYGANWVYEIAEKFEAVYASQGYKVNILKPNSDMRNNVALQQLARGYDATKVDLYISGGVPSTAAGKEGEYYSSVGVLCEEVSDMWDTKPIGYNGQEESKTLREKVTAGTVDAFKDNYGETYNIPYIASTGGMVVNKRKLALYGINTLPTTTNEMFDMWTAIYTGANGQQNSEDSQLFPFTFYNNAANAYTIDWFMLAMAQYDEKLFNEYWSWQTVEADGSVTWWENGVTAAANDAFLASVEVMAQAFDPNIACYGTQTQTLDQAQAQIMKQTEGAIFMCNGSWFLNDTALSYPSYLEDITFINFPVNSKLAVKLWGSQGKTEAQLENALRKAIACVDDLSKAGDLAACATEVTIATGVTVTEADMADVRRARYAYSDRTSSEGMFITKGSPKADIAKLFMRMIASDDAAKTIAEKANGNSAYMTTQNAYSQYTFVKDASKIFTGGYATGYRKQAQGYRLAMGKTQYAMYYPHLPTYIFGLANSASIYDGNGGLSGNTTAVYKALAADILAKEQNSLATGFDSWKTTNADRIATYKTILGYTK